LPSFITGGQGPQQQTPQQNSPQQNSPQQQFPQQGQSPNGGQNGPNGQNGYDGQADRFPLHRRRRRHRGGGGPRDFSADQSLPNDNDGQPASDPQSNDE
jgi:hypothetical protein